MYKNLTVTVGAAAVLLWETSSGQSPDPKPVFASGIFQSGEASKGGIPILLEVPTGTTLFIGVALGATTGGMPIIGPQIISFNPVGNDSLYGYATGGTTVYVCPGNQ